MTMHNLWHYQEHMRRIRAAIEAGTFAELLAETRAARPEHPEDV